MVLVLVALIDSKTDVCIPHLLQADAVMVAPSAMMNLMIWWLHLMVCWLHLMVWRFCQCDLLRHLRRQRGS